MTGALLLPSSRGSREVFESLLEPKESRVPEAVLRSAQLLEDLKVPYRLSRNPPVFDCRSAARQRFRLGRRGVALCHELKSFVGNFRGRDGSERCFVAHYRADRELDLVKLQRAVDASTLPRRLRDEELEAFGVAYGRVNPFAFEHDTDAIQRVLSVYDLDVLQPVDVLGTVFTNAGHTTWAVELDIVAFVHEAKKHGAQVADVTTPEAGEATRREPHRPWSLGVLTGNFPEAGVLFWESFQSHVRPHLSPWASGDLAMPQLHLHSRPTLGLAIELDEYRKTFEAELGRAIDVARSQDLDALAIPCPTTHLLAPAIQRLCSPKLPLLSMAQPLAAAVTQKGIRRVSWLGNPFVSGHTGRSPWGEALAGIEVLVPAGRTHMHLCDLVGRVRSGGVTPGTLNRFHDLLRRLTSKHVVLAMPELSLLARHQRKKGRGGKDLIDCIELYGEAVARLFLGSSLMRDSSADMGSMHS